MMGILILYNISGYLFESIKNNKIFIHSYKYYTLISDR
jgi:hypothetical protein